MEEDRASATFAYEAVYIEKTVLAQIAEKPDTRVKNKKDTG